MTRILQALVVVGLVVAVSPAQTLYLADSNTDTLHTIDITTGAATTVGSTGSTNAAGIGTPSGLAHDGVSLYTLDLGGGELATLDTTTGVPTVLGSTALSGWQDITWDPSTGLFYGVNQNGTLHSIDLLGNATLIGSTTPFGLVTAIAFDSAGALWGIDFSSGALGTLSTATGAFTQVSTSTVNNIQGMSFHPGSGILYANSTTTDSLYIIDPLTGTAVLVGAHGNGVAFGKGLRFEYSVPCPLVEYQTNSPPSTLDVDGVIAGPCTRAVTVKPLGSSGTINLASTNVGLPWDAGILSAPLLSASGGALITGLGQIVNLDISGPVSFLNGGSTLSLSTVWGSNFTLNFVTPAAPGTFSMQMLNVDPGFPDGFLLSQGSELQAQ